MTKPRPDITVFRNSIVPVYETIRAEADPLKRTTRAIYESIGMNKTTAFRCIAELLEVDYITGQKIVIAEMPEPPHSVQAVSYSATYIGEKAYKLFIGDQIQKLQGQIDLVPPYPLPYVKGRH